MSRSLIGFNRSHLRRRCKQTSVGLSGIMANGIHGGGFEERMRIDGLVCDVAVAVSKFEFDF